MDFIAALPAGYDTVIGEGGATLSGGEKQRISIARCLLKDAPIVIFDEATANVDPENEDQLQKAIEALTREKTVLMIAHRLKTVSQRQSDSGAGSGPHRPARHPRGTDRPGRHLSGLRRPAGPGRQVVAVNRLIRQRRAASDFLQSGAAPYLFLILYHSFSPLPFSASAALSKISPNSPLFSQISDCNFHYPVLG